MTLLADTLPVIGILAIAFAGAFIIFYAAIRILDRCEKKRFAEMREKAKWNWKEITNAPAKSPEIRIAPVSMRKIRALQRAGLPPDSTVSLGRQK